MKKIENYYDKCRKCPAVVYPYLNTLDEHSRRLPEERWLPTCPLNLRRPGQGFYGKCYPDICEGDQGRYYLVENKEVVRYYSSVDEYIESVQLR